MRTNDRQRVARRCVGNDDASSTRGRQHAIDNYACHEVHADEVSDVSRARMRRDLRKRAGLHDSPAFENRDAISERVRVDRIVCDENAHTVERVEVATQITTHAATTPGIERSEGLIEEQEPRIRGKGASERNSLRLTTGQRRWPLTRVVAQTDTVDPFTSNSTRHSLRDLPSAQSVRDIFDDGHGLEQQKVLKHESDLAELRLDKDIGTRVVDDDVVDGNSPFVDWSETCETAQYRALTCAIRTKEREEFPRSHLEFGSKIE